MRHFAEIAGVAGLMVGMLLAALPGRAAETWKPGPGWKLVWSDEFNGKTLDPKNWKHETGSHGWGNNELETYTNNPENASLHNGNLVIKALKTADGYTSARIKTQGLRSWKYGKVAARMRLPYGQGIWPAFWMMGDNISEVGWPKGGEIDIMEMIGGGKGRDDTTHGTLHWEANGKHASHGGSKQLPDHKMFHQDYHVFEIEWDADDIAWKLDGHEYFKTSVNTTAWPTMTAFHQPFFIILNLAVGGNWPGNPNETTVFPQTMEVDWVRVYQRQTGSKFIS
jgi:beta-glucanase (GH16 family)